MKLEIFSLNGCPYSMKAEKLLHKYNSDIIRVDHNEKSYYNNLNKMSTYPQLFLVDDKNNRIQIGGYDDTKILLTKIFNNNNIKYDKHDSLLLKNFFLNK